jgi:fucose permease
MMPSKSDFFNLVFLLISFQVTFTSFFSKIKVQKKSQNSRNQGFSSYFCLIFAVGRYSMVFEKGMGSDPDPAIFIIDLQDAIKK